MSEFDWIAQYLKPIANAPDAQGLDNDVARIGYSAGTSLIGTMDTLVEGVHFLTEDPIDTVARKLVRVNVSDIVCKGARPRGAFLSCALPQAFAEADFEHFAAAFADEARQWQFDLLGGDTVTTFGPAVFTLMMMGAGKPHTPILRSGARPGDAVCVTGAIGAGGLGLEDARLGQDSRHSAHYRIPLIPPLASSDIVADHATASIDVSDGLLADALHIAASSKVRVELDLQSVPWAEPPGSLEDAFRLATAGDDYQILFTVPEDQLDQCLSRFSEVETRAQRIGTVREGAGLFLRDGDENVPLPPVTGYQH